MHFGLYVNFIIAHANNESCMQNLMHIFRYNKEGVLKSFKKAY